MASTKPRPSVQQQAIHEWNGNSSKRSTTDYPRMGRPLRRVAVDLEIKENSPMPPPTAYSQLMAVSRGGSVALSSMVRHPIFEMGLALSSSPMPPPTAYSQLMAVSRGGSVALSSMVVAFLIGRDSRSHGSPIPCFGRTVRISTTVCRNRLLSRVEQLYSSSRRFDVLLAPLFSDVLRQHEKRPVERSIQHEDEDDEFFVVDGDW
ncbi:unnamed protein product [Haemonchus placei]|uniref:Uncharacterized protein n=1 Tax=Haemonchus placei TaxID=6290 RepID=A0A0N4X8D3_HAEPC|nr:unnamed protein product [Haemonchus placei]